MFPADRLPVLRRQDSAYTWMGKLASKAVAALAYQMCPSFFASILPLVYDLPNLISSFPPQASNHSAASLLQWSDDSLQVSFYTQCMIDGKVVLHPCIAFFGVLDRQDINARQRVRVIPFPTPSPFPQVLAGSSPPQPRTSFGTVALLPVGDTHQRVKVIRPQDLLISLQCPPVHFLQLPVRAKQENLHTTPVKHA